MKQYFIDKLKKLKEKKERIVKYIIEYANELNIKGLIEQTAQLQRVDDDIKGFTKDAVMYLSVPEVIELLDQEFIADREAAYVYQYEKAITIGERDVLQRRSYQYRDAKVR